MLKRTVTGAIYVAIIAGFFLLRNYVDYRLFNILTFAFCALGTFEVARALKSRSYKGNFTLAIVFGCIFAPVFCAVEYLTNLRGAFASLILCEIAILYQVILFTIKEMKATEINFKADLKTFAVNLLPFVYPALLLLTMLSANEFGGQGHIVGFIALLLIFVISPASDTFAYLVGMTYNKIRKGQAKRMCPRLSPKKTWAGAIGGVVGGVVGALVVYFATNTAILEGGKISVLLAFIIIGVVASVLTEIGDLFESLIKRKVGIKDMGKIMPGHGGIMDRIDGMSFAAVFVFAVFAVLL